MERSRLLRLAGGDDAGLRVPAAGQDFREPERLGDLEALLCPIDGKLAIPGEPVPAAKTHEQERQVRIGLVPADELVGALHPLYSALHVTAQLFRIGEPCRRATGRVRISAAW